MTSTQPSQCFSKDASPIDVLSLAVEMVRNGEDVCVATVIGTQGSCPATPGQKLIVGKNRSASGTVGGGALERKAVEEMTQLLEAGVAMPELRSYSLREDFGMACGGIVQLLFEPHYSAISVLVVGAGHIGSALAALLVRLGFRVVLTDQRPEAASVERFSHLRAVSVRLGAPDEVAGDTPTSVPVVVATHDHDLDIAAVTWAVARGHDYVGGIGSKAKAAKARKAMRERGLSKETMDRLRMPVGLPIGGRTSEEIALSVAAELVAWRYGKLPPAKADPGTGIEEMRMEK